MYFSAPNESGILDHRVVRDGSEPVFVPMRVFPNGSGAEIIVTLFQWPGLSDAYFERDAETTSKDLNTLKRLLESDQGI
ncbi:MAG: polyketide cyclase [Hyphomicrobiales bacterium]|nr:polyketide cyclase [Hyphomicrobiales bacterium]